MGASDFSARQREVLARLSQPAADVLEYHQIRVREPSAQGYRNVSRCPWCGHGPANFQCGIKEVPGPNGLLHRYKCFHPHDAPQHIDTPHWADVLARLGELTPDEVAWCKRLGTDKMGPSGFAAPRSSSGGAARPVNVEHLEKQCRRLAMNEPAIRYLKDARGYSDAVLQKFKLGLSFPYTSPDTNRCDALCAPLVGRDGRLYSKYVYYHLPEVTFDRDPTPRLAWCKGEAATYYSRACTGEERLVVVDGMKDLWSLWQAIQGTDLHDLVLISSTHGGGNIPAEWRSPDYWTGWSTVMLAHDNDQPNARTGTKAGDEHAQKIASLAGRDCIRLWPVGCKDWNEFFVRGATVDDFRRLLAAASPMNANGDRIAADLDSGYCSGEVADIESGYHNGYLFHTMTVVDRTREAHSERITESKRTVAIRSDRTLHHAEIMPAPAGTPSKDRVWRLVPDGSILRGALRPKRWGSWTWTSVQAFLRGEETPKPLAQLLRAVIAHLQGTVWLPSDDDYVVLACTIAVTYVQAAFDAVPSILISGESSTGKSKLTIAVNGLFANALPSPIGTPSAAALAQLVHETRGPIAVDDIEELAKCDGSDCSDKLIQLLKVSHKKQTAVKASFSMKNATAETFNTFGVKLFNNTSGVGRILGSRMHEIRTARRPEKVRLDLSGRLSPTEQVDLRNELHTWAFTNIEAVVAAYLQHFPDPSSRAEEISAPLKVVARLSQDAELEERLLRALKPGERPSAHSAETLLDDAIREILVLGAKQFGLVRQAVSVTEVRMRMELSIRCDKSSTRLASLANIDSPEWIGRQILRRHAREHTDQRRVNLFGTYLRGHRLSDKTIEEALAPVRASLSTELQESSDLKAFCRSCTSCDYVPVCPVRVARMERETANAA